ncbi:Hpt domain-containing protein [Aliiroseovarius sp. KMU-50]|uniref:Hpt domain-containing protein n=1 Tax=Aliiroseovarius salicola TaxID=3009082 RepID=A0ABT4VW37_9RHOB|nr:Hpt domain-containing protein [Aliiroseovarius sp. KMU-50]MDA5092474.1 Hpt domain-containing protein [Aliiroseovarius sp. KMU-50]
MGKTDMNASVIDIDALRRLLAVIGGDTEDLDELLRDFQSEAPELVDRMQLASRLGDIDALRIAAHTLKSNARDFGAVELSALCATMEQECRDNRGSEHGEKVDEIAVQMALAVQELSKLVEVGLNASGATD